MDGQEETGQYGSIEGEGSCIRFMFGAIQTLRQSKAGGTKARNSEADRSKVKQRTASKVLLSPKGW